MAAVVVAGLFAVPALAQLNPFTRAGFDLTEQDVVLLQESSEKLYIDESVPVGTVETWSNADSGNTGSVQLVGAFEHKGLPCRRLQHDIKIKNVADPFRYIVDRCKIPSGEWKTL
jgi:surface antigen